MHGAWQVVAGDFFYFLSSEVAKLSPPPGPLPPFLAPFTSTLTDSLAHSLDLLPSLTPSPSLRQARE
jgi:hypothetical protein